MNKQRQQRQPAQLPRIRRILNWGVGFGVASGICAFAFRPPFVGPVDSAAWATLNGFLRHVAIVLPGLDAYQRDLVNSGHSDYAAYVGSFFVFSVIVWLISFCVIYRALARLSSTELAKEVEAKKSYGKPPYAERHMRMAFGFSLFMVVAVVIALRWWLGGNLPDMKSTLMRFILLGSAGWAINVYTYLFHVSRQFLASIYPDGLMVNEGGQR